VSQNSTEVFHMQTLHAAALSALALAQNFKSSVQSSDSRSAVLKWGGTSPRSGALDESCVTNRVQRLLPLHCTHGGEPEDPEVKVK